MKKTDRLPARAAALAAAFLLGCDGFGGAALRAQAATEIPAMDAAESVLGTGDGSDGDNSLVGGENSAVYGDEMQISTDSGEVTTDNYSVYASEIEAGAVDTEAQLEKARENGTLVIITDVSDLEDFAKACGDDWTTYGKVYSLEADISLGDTDISCFPWFNGTLLGNGHTISGLDLEQEGSAYGLFRYVGRYGYISNLNVEGEVIMSGSAQNTGGICGINYGTISGCTFRGVVSGQTAAGGICGLNKPDALIDNCAAEGTVSSTDSTGGIVGENRGNVLRCVNKASIDIEDLRTVIDMDGIDLGALNITTNVTTRNDLGGIAGLSTGMLLYCTNQGNVGYAHAGYNVGGICGRQSGLVIGCLNNSEVLGRKDVGGVVGQAEPYIESEYLRDRLNQIKEDTDYMNSLVIQMSDAMSDTSASVSSYVYSLQDQFEDTLSSVNAQISELDGYVTSDDSALRSYVDSISSSLSGLSAASQELMSRVRNDAQGALNSANSVIEKYTENSKNTINTTLNEMKKVVDTLPDEDVPVIKPSDDPSEDGESSDSSSSDGSSTDSSLSDDTSSESSDSVSEAAEETSSAAAVSDASAVSEDVSEQTQRPVSEDIVTDAGDGNSTGGSGDSSSDSTGGSGDSSSDSTGGSGNAGTGDAQQQIEDAADAVRDRAEQAASEAQTDITQTSLSKDDVKNAINKVQNAVNQASTPQLDVNLSESGYADSFNSIRSSLDSISQNLSGAASTATDLADSTAGSASGIAQNLTDRSKASGQDVDGLTNAADSGIQSITASLNRLMETAGEMGDTISDSMKVVMGDDAKVEDISDGNLTGYTTGIISGCTNRGTVSADLKVGGIVGAMNVENGLDPETDYDFSQLTDVTVRSTVLCAVLHCANYGDVTAKKDEAGGTAGSEDLGIIYGCENYGAVASESGSYLGGIAGSSSSTVRGSYSFCNVTGSGYVGGIAGSGSDIRSCVSACWIECSGEYAGGIAGQIASEASLENNYYVSDKRGGVDGIDYYGQAVQVTYEQLMASDMELPDGFSSVPIRFVKGGTAVRTVRVPYGGTLEEGDAPQIEATESYVEWDCEFPLTDITHPLTIEAKEQHWVTALASEQMDEESGKPVVLAEGTFYLDSELNLTQLSEVPDDRTVYSYRFEIGNEAAKDSVYKVHFLIPEGRGVPVVYMKKDGRWKKLDTETDGSYAVAEAVSGSELALVMEPENIIRYLMMAAGGGLLLFLVIILRLRYKRKHGKLIVQRVHRKIREKKEKAE